LNFYLLLHFLHLSAAIVFVGGLFARQAVRALISGASELGAVVTLTQAAGRVERLMVIPGNLLAIAFGLMLALYGRAPIFGFVQGAQRNWLLAAVLVLVLLFPLVPLVFLPRGQRFEAALRKASAEGQITPALRQQMQDPVVRWAHMAEMTGVGLILILMVFKPF